MGKAPSFGTSVNDSATVVVGTPSNSPLIGDLPLKQAFKQLGPDGYLIRSTTINGYRAILIASASEVGALYGSFHFLRLMQTLQPLENLNINQRPRLHLRVLDHWDNLDGSVERGYAGRSLWDWSALPKTVDPRLRDYARANASIGINGSVLNNVNANAQVLTPEYLKKVAAIAASLQTMGNSSLPFRSLLCSD